MKKRYLCPVCDQELTVKSYCPECRRIRRTPIIYEGWLLPNESDREGMLQEAALPVRQTSRPRTSQGTANRTAPGKGTARSGTSGGRQVSSGGRVYDSRYMDACGSGHDHAYGVPNQDPHKKKRGAKKAGSGTSSWIVWVIVVLVIISVAAAVFSGPARMFLDEIAEEFGIESFRYTDGGEREEQDTAPVIFGDANEDDYIVLSEEEVVAAGEPCNGFYHYDIDGDAYLARLSKYAGDLWPEEAFEVEWKESDNQVYKSEYTSFSYYRREAQVFLDNGVYYTVVCDTVTGEVMEVRTGADTEEEFARAILLAACALEPDKDRNGIWSELGGLLKEMKDGEYYFGDWGISEIYISGGLSYYGSLSCLQEYDKYR